jgi:3-oxoadipate enol-lactonase / 4-carboxymuconolactone decarboxylase
VTLHHQIEGEGDRVVVLSGSLGSSLALWDLQAPALAERFRVLRYDHPGHGRSLLSDDRTIEALAAQLLELLDDLGFARVSFCGLSLGGAVGMRAALDAPERIEKLVLCSTSARFATPEFWDRRAAAVRSGGVEAIADEVLDRWFTPGFPDVRRYRDMLVSTPAEGYARCCEAVRDWDVRGALGAVQAPTMAIAGADDRSTPPDELKAIAAEIPSARLTVLDGRHLVNVEQADAFNEALLAHLGVMTDSAHERGMKVRREVLGDEHVDRAIERTTEHTADFQDFITRYAWGEIWNRPGLDRRTRSCITITALVALGRFDELELHIRAAQRTGVANEEIKEVLLQCAVYCGVPAANSAFAVFQRVLDEQQ